MNDLVREYMEIRGYHVVLKAIPEYETDARRLFKFLKFKREKKTTKRSKAASKLSFEINFDEEDVVLNDRSIVVEPERKLLTSKKTKKTKQKRNTERIRRSRCQTGF